MNAQYQNSENQKTQKEKTMARFIKNQDNTVTDIATGLTFKIVKSDDYVNFATAEKLIAELGDGWRMPNDTEALLPIDRSRYSPAVDPELFSEIGSGDWYWTSTPCKWAEDTAVWVVGFDDGGVGKLRRSGYACVLAVRSSQ